MKLGVPKEIKNNEHRVSLTPQSVGRLAKLGAHVFVEKSAGLEIGFTDEMFVNNGATILDTAAEIFSNSELIIKVKEPQEEELKYLTPDKTLFTYLHLAGDKQQAKKLLVTGVTGIAYETVTASDGSLPLLSPMSKIAGKISIVVGQYFLLKPNQGIGTLLGSVDQIEPRTVTVIGAGVAGKEAIKKAISTGAKVNILDLSEAKLTDLEAEFGSNNIKYLISSEEKIIESISSSDLVIGSVYVVGKEAPKVVTKEMLSEMKPGSVMVDISIDQGGCFETSKPTTHDNPIYKVEDVTHYCVTNMPGAVPLTSTLALNEATLPFIEEIVKSGLSKSLSDNEHLAAGVNIMDGEIIHPAIKEALN